MKEACLKIQVINDQGTSVIEEWIQIELDEEFPLFTGKVSEDITVRKGDTFVVSVFPAHIVEVRTHWLLWYCKKLKRLLKGE